MCCFFLIALVMPVIEQPARAVKVEDLCCSIFQAVFSPVDAGFLFGVICYVDKKKNPVYFMLLISFIR